MLCNIFTIFLSQYISLHCWNRISIQSSAFLVSSVFTTKLWFSWIAIIVYCSWIIFKKDFSRWPISLIVWNSRACSALVFSGITTKVDFNLVFSIFQFYICYWISFLIPSFICLIAFWIVIALHSSLRHSLFPPQTFSPKKIQQELFIIHRSIQSFSWD